MKLESPLDTEFRRQVVAAANSLTNSPLMTVAERQDAITLIRYIEALESALLTARQKVGNTDVIAKMLRALVAGRGGKESILNSELEQRKHLHVTEADWGLMLELKEPPTGS